MVRYLSMIKKDIKEFMKNTNYHSLAELQPNWRRWEIELETHARMGEMENHRREKRFVLVQSQPATKRFKPADSRS